MELDEAQGGVAFGQRFVRLDGPERGLLRPLPGLLRRRLDVPVQKRVAIGHLGERESELRVSFDGALESFYRLPQPLGRPARGEVATGGVKLLGFGVD